MLCKEQYEIRKPLLLGRQIRNSFIIQEELHEDVLIELKQIAEFYNIKDVKDLIYTKKIYYSHSVFMVDEEKFNSFTYSDEHLNHFKFIEKKLTDYYEERTPHIFNNNISWEQYNPKTMELENRYCYKPPLEIKYDSKDKEIGSLVFIIPPAVAELKNKIVSCGLSLEDFIPLAWGYKSYGLSVEFHPKETLCGLGSWISTDWIPTDWLETD
tara:strand:+ start:665 stop:1300 length:636 start_codon:yes stop_codon:yes gene_type:complete